MRDEDAARYWAEQRERERALLDAFAKPAKATDALARPEPEAEQPFHWRYGAEPSAEDEWLAEAIQELKDRVSKLERLTQEAQRGRK
jgi:hypothetical protein